MKTIRETTHHGQYHHTREVPVARITPAAALAVITGGPYIYQPSPLTEEAARRLCEAGYAEHGWSRWEVVAPDLS